MVARLPRWSAFHSTAIALPVLVFSACADLPADEEAEARRSQQRQVKLLFASSFANGLTEFPERINRERIAVVDDPVLGRRRKVLRFRVYNGDTAPTANPRAQLETPYDFRPGDDRYMGFSYRFGPAFPTRLPSRAWVTLGSIAYGPPFAGAAPVSIRVQNHVGSDGRAELRWQRNATYEYDIPWAGPRIADVRGRWIDFVIRTRLSRDPRRGFVELWMNTGSGWARQRLHGRRRLHMRTYDDSNGGGPNNSRVSLYYRRDIPGPLTVFHGPVKIARAGPGAFQAVAPRSHG